MANQKILIVEDDEVLRNFYVELLTTEGFTVEEALDGDEGWKKVSRGGYGLIILDIVLPRKDGMEILRDLRKKPPTKPNGPIIILTNLGQETIVKEGFALGAAGYIIKSAFNPDQILTEIRNFLGKK